MKNQLEVPVDSTPLAPKNMMISAVWLRRMGDHAQLLVEIDGEWRLAISELHDGNLSHIAEARGVNHWPSDDMT